MSRRRKSKPTARSPVAAILEPYAKHLRMLAIPYRLTNQGKWEGLICAAEVLDAARAVNLDVPELDPEGLERLAQGVALLREASELLRELGADVASALAVAGGAAPLPSRTWITKKEDTPELATDISDPAGFLKRVADNASIIVGDVDGVRTVRKGERVAFSVNGRRYESPPSTEPLGKPERALLAVLAQRSPQPTTRAQLAICSGYSSSSSSFANALGKLRRLKLAGDEGAMIFATVDGLAAAPDVAQLPKGKALRDYWLTRCNRPERAVLAALIDAYPHPLDRDELARAAQYSPTSSSFANALGKLRTLELVRGLRASSELMEDA